MYPHCVARRLFMVIACCLLVPLAHGTDDYRSLSIPRSNNNAITIGSGIDVDLVNQQRSACLNYKDSDVAWLDGAGAVQTNATIELVSDYTSLAKTLNLEVDYKSKADVNFAALKAGASSSLNIKYDSFAKDENRNLAIVVKAFSDYGRRGLTQYSLDEKFRHLIDDKKFDEFRTACGTHTVVAQHNQSMVAVVLLISASSAASKKSIEATYKTAFEGKATINAVGVSGNVEMGTRWKTIVETAERLGKIKIDFESRGGAGISDALKVAVSADPENINSILSTLTTIGTSFTQTTSAPVGYLLVPNTVFGVKEKVSDPAKLEALNNYYLQLTRVDYAISRVDGYNVSFPDLAVKYQSSPQMLELRAYRNAYFGERDRRFRERDRFGKVGRCAVSIVDFLASSGRVLVRARLVSEMVF
ncbi:putative uncharacterized protein [Caballeronia insecticola]|uniref:Uncharacterized protein n=1 Tax=Caballeronia insecticola TaxID=758793 RepID=R4WFV9_9BURK|nr:putative uncharacterized protein [Caballeronia insecticola]